MILGLEEIGKDQGFGGIQKIMNEKTTTSYIPVYIWWRPEDRLNKKMLIGKCLVVFHALFFGDNPKKMDGGVGCSRSIHPFL